MKELGTQALSNNKLVSVPVKFQTFYTQNQKPQKTKPKPTEGKGDEVSALLRMTQVVASGGEVDIINFIGNHECSKTPPSLFTEDSEMQSGSKASLVKAIKYETGIQASSSLPSSQKQTCMLCSSGFSRKVKHLEQLHTITAEA